MGGEYAGDIQCARDECDALDIAFARVPRNAMRFTKPTWVMHRGVAILFLPCILTDTIPSQDSAKDTKRLAIFSIHVHPDGSRIATGGLDAKVRIWSTKPILNPASERSNRPPKSLCTLSMHTGPVLTIRWAHSGRWLASGSDDEIIMIWDLDPCVYLYNALQSVVLIRGHGTGLAGVRSLVPTRLTSKIGNQ